MVNQLRNFKIILLTALQTLYEVRVVLARALTFPLFIYFFLTTIKFNDYDGVVDFFLLLANFFVLVAIGISIHRVILIGPDSVSKWGFNKWGDREMNYFLWLLNFPLSALPFAFVFIFSAIEFLEDAYYQRVLLVSAGWVLILWIWSRLAMILPHIAMDQSIHRSNDRWEILTTPMELTSKHQFTMFLVVVSSFLLSLPLYYFSPENLFTKFYADIWYISIVVFTCATLSTAYKFIMDEKAKTISVSE